METQAENKGSSQQTKLKKVLEKINEIAKESDTGDYIYRGEPAHYQEPLTMEELPQVSIVSTLTLK